MSLSVSICFFKKFLLLGQNYSIKDKHEKAIKQNF
jgi:hypothetical protein